MTQRPIWFFATTIALLLRAAVSVASFAARVFVGEKMAAEQGAWGLGCCYRALPAWFARGCALGMRIAGCSPGSSPGRTHAD